MLQVAKLMAAIDTYRAQLCTTGSQCAILGEFSLDLGIDKMLISALMNSSALMAHSSPTGGPRELIQVFLDWFWPALSIAHLINPLAPTVLEKFSKNLIFWGKFLENLVF